LKGRREAEKSGRRLEEAIKSDLEEVMLRLWTGFNGHRDLSSSGEGWTRL